MARPIMAGWPAAAAAATGPRCRRAVQYMPDAGGQQGAQDQEDRDVHEVVQGRLGDVADALHAAAAAASSFASSSSASARPGARPAASAAALPCLRYCHSTSRPVHDGDQVAQPDAQADHPVAAHLRHRALRADSGRRRRRRRRRCSACTTTLMIGPASM